MLSKILVLISAISISTVYAAPIAAEVAADFAANVLMTSGASQFAMWVPTTGSAYATSSITCLNILSSSTGSCDITSIDNIAAVAGYACAFDGSDGWSATQTGTNNTGWMSVSPPQKIEQVACVAT